MELGIGSDTQRKKLVDGIGRQYMKTYEHRREAEEELADIRAYDVARPKVEADIKAGRICSLNDYRAKRAAKLK